MRYCFSMLGDDELTMAQVESIEVRDRLVEKVKEIIEDNKKGVFPEQLEDFAFIKEQKNNDYGEEGKPADLSKLE